MLHGEHMTKLTQGHMLYSTSESALPKKWAWYLIKGLSQKNHRDILEPATPIVSEFLAYPHWTMGFLQKEAHMGWDSHDQGRKLECPKGALD